MADLRQNTWETDTWYAQSVAGNTGYRFALDMWTWGNGTNGQLGNNQAYPGPTAQRSSPVQVGNDSNWMWLGTSSGANRAHVIKNDGSLWTWGRNEQGCLGMNNQLDYSSPIQIGLDTTWSKVDGGEANTIAIKTDGTLWAWGWNEEGRLGQNDQSVLKRSSPMQIGTGTDWETINAGKASLCATKTDGTLWVWGNNTSGMLGVNDNANRSSPTQIPGTSWKLGRTGVNFSVYLRTNGQLFACGSGTNGQLGNNKTNPYSYSSPIQIPGTWAQVDVNTAETDPLFTLGVKTNGAMYVWGRAFTGQLGIGVGYGTWARRSSPTQLPGTWNIDLNEGGQETISANDVCAAKKDDDSWWVWGKGIQGCLGLNEGGPAPASTKGSPVQLPGSFDIIQAGRSNMMAFRQP